MSSPNVNFMLGYVNSIKGKKSNDKYLQKYLEERRFYSCNKEYNYLKYVNEGSKEKIDFVDYSGNKEKSHGVFGVNGLLDEKQIEELRGKLRNTKSVIWHGVISFTEDFGNAYCNNYETAYRLIRTELPKFFKKANLNPNNIEWFAGFHTNTDNKHIHISFFEKSPERYRRNKEKLVYSDGLLPQKAINSAKVNMELKLLNIAEDIYLQRDTLTNLMKKQMETGVFMREINSLLLAVPNQGRISYDSDNIKPYKNQIDMVVNALIKSDKELLKGFKYIDNLLIKRDLEIKNAYEKINVDYKDKLLYDKCMTDLYRRLGNIVLYTLRDIRREQIDIEYKTSNRLALKRIEKNKRKIMLNKCLKLNELVNKEALNAFADYMNKLQEVNYNRLKEEGYIE